MARSSTINAVERAELKDGDLLRTGKTVLKYLENNIELEYMQHILNLATVDSLTGLYNKRHFDEVFGKEVARADQQPAPAVTDPARHRPLQEDQRQLRASRGRRGAQARGGRRQEPDPDRATRLCRVGGEEFALVLPQTPLVLATQAAELIRAAVDDTACDFAGTIIPATLSLGVASSGRAKCPRGCIGAPTSGCMPPSTAVAIASASRHAFATLSV